MEGASRPESTRWGEARSERDGRTRSVRPSVSSGAARYDVDRSDWLCFLSIVLVEFFNDIWVIESLLTTLRIRRIEKAL